MNYSVADNQTIFDIAVIGAGTAESAYSIAYGNSISASAIVPPGSVLTVDAAADKKVVAFFAIQAHLPATGIMTTDGLFDNTFDNTYE